MKVFEQWFTNATIIYIIFDSICYFSHKYSKDGGLIGIYISKMWIKIGTKKIVDSKRINWEGNNYFVPYKKDGVRFVRNGLISPPTPAFTLFQLRSLPEDEIELVSLINPSFILLMINLLLHDGRPLENWIETLIIFLVLIGIRKLNVKYLLSAYL